LTYIALSYLLVPPFENKDQKLEERLLQVHLTISPIHYKAIHWQKVETPRIKEISIPLHNLKRRQAMAWNIKLKLSSANGEVPTLD
jgi:hypothetical protein